MKQIIFSAVWIISTLALNAQDNAATIKEKDSTIMANLIMPALQAAISDHSEPDWDALSQNIRAIYDDYYVQRMVLKGKIYFYFQNSAWAEFAKAIVQFTEKYEDKNDLKLMNKNANFILKYSTDKKELQTAAKWSKYTMDKEPSNQTYQATYKALQEKLK